MSDAEMIEEFETRICNILKRSDITKHPNGLVTYDTDSWRVAATNYYVEITVATVLGPRIAYQRGHYGVGKIKVDYYQTEELLKSMRAHMILDDLADI